MSQELDKELQEGVLKLIEENYPKKVGSILSKRLTQADETERELERVIKDKNMYVKRAEEARKDIEALQNEIGTFKDREASIKANEAQIESRTLQLDNKERELEMKLLQKELELTKESKNDIFKLTDRVFRNHTVRETVMKNVIGSPSGNFEYDQQNNSRFVPDGGRNEVENVTTEKLSEDQD